MASETFETSLTDQTSGTDQSVRVADDLRWLLEGYLKRVPGTSGALLASRDGLKKAVAGLEVDEADNLSARVCGLHALARGLGGRKDSTHDGVRQIVIEHDDLLLFVMSAAEGSLLSVLAEPDADPGVVGHEMSQLVTSAAEHLHTAARHSRSPSAGEAGA